ncbi:MAG: hypothetical protein A2X94_15405 [Bdellovibrionales bacterium GWB1_55_8]|nr:MAG: hypothetical protein A2X94_15405 [Bdellovibrionales bacterium GWB1_55_8]
MKTKRATSKKNKVNKKEAECQAICLLMTGKKAKAFGRAGAAFYKDYLKLAKKQGNKKLIQELEKAVVELSQFGKEGSCGCT